MKPISDWKQCFVCKTLFDSKSANNVIVYVELENEFGETVGTGTYVYCSEKCTNANLDTLGVGLPIQDRIQVMGKNQISTSPNRWRVICKELKLNIESA
jgi:hypothetical protein